MGGSIQEGAPLVVIWTIYRRSRDRYREIAAAIYSGTKWPDLLIVGCEDEEDADKVDYLRRVGAEILIVPTPKENDRYLLIPYSLKINAALDLVASRYEDAVITYCTDDSKPSNKKYELMYEECIARKTVVYCSQLRVYGMHEANSIVHNAYCVIDHTQVMHPLSEDRWPVRPEEADIRLGDAHFWLRLHARFGPFYPVPGALDIIVREEGERGITTDGWIVSR